MSDTFYRKVGRRYVEVGSDIHLYCDGIWLVYRSPHGKRQSCVFITADMPRLPLIAYHTMQDELTALLTGQTLRGISPYDRAGKICEFFAQAAAKQIES